MFQTVDTNLLKCVIVLIFCFFHFIFHIKGAPGDATNGPGGQRDGHELF